MIKVTMKEVMKRRADEEQDFKSMIGLDFYHEGKHGIILSVDNGIIKIKMDDGTITEDKIFPFRDGRKAGLEQWTDYSKFAPGNDVNWAGEIVEVLDMYETGASTESSPDAILTVKLDDGSVTAITLDEIRAVN
jgi:hypothetical protein